MVVLPRGDVSGRTLKVFFLSWFSFAWFFVGVIAPMNKELSRSFAEWLLRGVLAGLGVGAVSAYLDNRQQAKTRRREQQEQMAIEHSASRPIE